MRFRLWLWYYKVRSWFSMQECFKESMGYTCRHRVYSDGTKECGNK